MRYIKLLINLLTIQLMLVLVTGCSLKTPPSEAPKPKDNRFHKSFFVEWDDKAKVEKNKKTFLCGNSFLSTWGKYRTARINNNNNLRNCNNVFEITKNELIAKHVNPALPKAYDQWTPIMSFRITHYNVEKSRDTYGRETNKTVETAKYDDWRNQEYLEIDFSSMKILNFEDLLVDVDAVEDHEFDKEGGFLGFTANVNSRVFYGSKFHGALRVNFLEMPKTKEFIPSPYHKILSKHANVLNIMGGKRPSGDVFTYMGKWNTKKINKFYINNFPKEYQDVAIDVVNDWNNAFDKIGHGKPLEAVIGDEERTFDLRKPSITWINDKRLSNGGLLGIAQNTADVTTGEMHWGAVSVWVDFLKRMIDNSVPAGAFSGGEDGSFKHSVQTGFLDESFQKGIQTTDFSNIIPSTLSDTKALIESHYAEEIEAANKNLVLLEKDLESAEEVIKEEYKHLKGLNREDYIQLTQRTKNALTRDIPLAFQEDFQNLHRQSKTEERDFSQLTMQKLIGQPSLKETVEFFKDSFSKKDSGRYDAQAVLEKVMDEMNQQDGFHCDRTAFDYLSALGDVNGSDDSRFLNKDQIFRVVLKFLLSHELGHVLGLGHNFKENIMPAKGSVPDKIYNELLVKHDKDLTNVSSVMGYPSAKTEVLFNYKDVIPFVGDLHTMELIYNQRYPMYSKDGDGSDCFGDKSGNLHEECYAWQKLEHDGKLIETIEKDSKKLSVGYLPFCNNGDQFIGDDPYCQTNDRGSSAVELVENYISEYSDYVSTGLYNIANDLTTRPFYVQENHLWWRSLSSFSKMRVFYDYMRRHYDEDIFKIGAKSVNDSYYTEFSNACELAYKGDLDKIEHEGLKKLFQSKQDDKRFVDLCYASKKSIEYIGSLISLSGKDYTVIDYENRSFVWQQIEGESTYDMDQAYGTWHSLARTPLKFSAIYALTLPNAFRPNYWRGVIFPSPILTYSRQDAKYHYSILFPKEYNKSISDGVIANLHFGDDGEDPYIGRSILALGYLQGMLRHSNDTLSIRSPYKKLLMSQTQFTLSNALVQVDKVEGEDDDDKKKAKKFNASLLEGWGRSSTKLKDFYFYTDNQVVLDPPVRTLIYPFGSVFWYTTTVGLMRAIKVSYDFDKNKLLSENSLKSQLTQRLNYLTKNCIEGPGEEKNGLKYYFNDTSSADDAFKGFDFSLRIMDNEDQFYYSIAKEYEHYYGAAFKENKPNRAACDKAIKAQNLLVTAAGMLNGIYFPEAFELIEKGGF